MAKANPIRLGIIGLGRAGRSMHCGELKGREKEFEIVAVCDLIKERREEVAAMYGCKAYRRIEDLLADPNVEMADVATRSCDHFRHASMAMKAGKDVFLEKPICQTYDEAKKLKALSAKSKGNLYIRHNRRFDPVRCHVQEIMDSGILGDVYEIKLRFNDYDRRADWQTIRRFGGGLLMNWGPHIIDHGLRLLDSPLKDIWSDLRLVAALGDAEDHLKIILTGRNGRVVDLEVSGGAAVQEPNYIVFGTKGALTSDMQSITLRYINPKEKLPRRKADPGTPGRSGFMSGEKIPWIEKTIAVRPKNKRAGSGAEIWDDLYNSVRKRMKFTIKLDEALEVMRVISAAKKGTKFAPRAGRK